MVGAGIVETKQDNANKISTTQREDLAKIQVERNLVNAAILPPELKFPCPLGIAWDDPQAGRTSSFVSQAA